MLPIPEILSSNPVHRSFFRRYTYSKCIALSDKEGVPTQGGRNSSVESSMRTIRQSQVRCTLYTFIVEFSTKFVIFEKKDENKQKEPVFGPFILKRSRTLSKNGCFVYFDFEKMKSC